MLTCEYCGQALSEFGDIGKGIPAPTYGKIVGKDKKVAFCGEPCKLFYVIKTGNSVIVERSSPNEAFLSDFERQGIFEFEDPKQKPEKYSKN